MAELNVEKQFYTQTEIAQLFTVSEGTVKNWRERGKLPYFRIDGSSRVLYPCDGIRQIISENLKPAKEVVNRKKPSEIKRKKPDVSSKPKPEWRIQQ